MAGASRLADLIGQPAAVALLQRVISGGRFANAYLFHGPLGVGKGSAALAFARAILCERSPAGTGDACGECRACVKAQSLQHPDLKLLFPVSGEEKDLDEIIADTLASLRDDALFVFTYDRAASIRLSMTRDLLRELGYRPFESSRRVVVVRDADRMREDQFSALLKAIEEPHATTVWVLTTSRPLRLPATIRSRCQSIRFAPLPESTVAAFLEERAGITGRKARLLAALSAGSLGGALAMRDQDAVAVRDRALTLLEPALRGDTVSLWRAVQGFGRSGRGGRETLRRVIEFHALWLRDLLRARHDAGLEKLVNRDRESDLRAQARHLDEVEIRRRLMVLEEVLRAIEGNVSPELSLFSGVARLGGMRWGETPWPGRDTARSIY